MILISKMNYEMKPEVNEEDEMVVPADENFPRCPISKEVFENVWDDELGDLMYRNAVKVLVARDNDDIFKLGKPTNHPYFSYMIVHKLLVLDRWLSGDKVESVKVCIERLKASTNDEDAKRSLIEAIVLASEEEDEDEEDVYVFISKDTVTLPTEYELAPHEKDEYYNEHQDWTTASPPPSESEAKMDYEDSIVEAKEEQYDGLDYIADSVIG